ncbi:polyprenol phosphomannose-dependent alpha 1,6 mannosyltransferase MptB [uncultured Jatrophihabitans sp.]|uniref:polyprenol phosphomannose-dependent alpha 1,6 mannosyltransferase MptB n=1 Tax=uncultured Jatrophihabitans sp. TaxID=1610747 RepID=UPI0035C9B009
MNDLAEKALHGLDTARRQVGNRPVPAFASAGFLLAASIVVAGGRVGAATATRPLSTWLGLQDAHVADTRGTLPGALLLAAVLALTVLWLVVVWFVRRHPQPMRRMWLLAGAWAVPFAVGPPLLDTAVYGYASYGLLQREGADPYVSAPSSLGARDVVAAIDPGARGTPSAAGPLGTVLQHLAVSISSGSALGAVLVLRAVAVLAVILLGVRAADLAEARRADPDAGGRRDCALALTVLNPALLLYVVSAAHLDGLLIALVVTALALAAQHRWLAGVIVASLAGCLLGQGWLVAAVLVVAHWHVGRDRTRRHRTRAAVREVGVAVAIGAAAGFAVPHGFGWVTSVGQQFSTHTPYSIAGGVSVVLAPVVRGASYDDLAVGGRAAALIAMACAVVYVVATARRRPPELSAGGGLLAIALFAPSLFPWYLLWPAACYAPTANAGRRALVLVLGAGACVLAPSGFTPTAANVVTGVLLGVLAVAVATGVRLAPAGDLANRGADVGEVDGRDDDRDE